ncbi:hypothetical protein GPJ56_008148 [Histomonas meleagridis]|uniref:uncharacterized protein n=1 Tax=Histomonas meleagridis TaxID=135588 RepID=UPI00355AA071|nr:hypothetical protein GPJ56_008148 [Histomonas meleagridis]KAH0803112.1 hypothetical protein GO595_004205 [Histomonas meleagridis]
MHKTPSQIFLETGGDFKTTTDWSILSRYLILLDETFILQDTQLIDRLLMHFKECKEKIVKAHEEINERIEALKQKDPDKLKKIPIPTRTESNRDVRLIFRFLIDKIVRMNIKSDKHRISQLDSHRQLLVDLQNLMDYLINKPIPFSVKVERAIVGQKFRPSSAPPSVLKRNMIRSFAHYQQVRLQMIPTPFDSDNENKSYLKDIIDAGVMAKKPGTSYFIELPSEDTLHVFFRSPKSPLLNPQFNNGKVLYPYDGGNDNDSVKQWISNSVASFIKWYGNNELNDDQVAALEILLVRFLFAETYPKFYPEPSYDEELVKKMENFGKRTPKDIGILDKFVPEQCVGKPVIEMFEVDSISRAPKEWFHSAINQFSPIDAAYCIVKVHEALSVMAVLRVTSKKENSDVEDFYQKMPGFDEIFEIWMALVCATGEPDPNRLMNFINNFSCLPGFTSRVMASIAYLEASLTQLADDK